MSELYELPEGWEWKKLDDITELVTKGTTPTTNGYKFLNKGINFLKIENIVKGEINLSTIEMFISEEAHQAQKRSQLKENDVLFSIAGTIGDTAIVKKEHLPMNTNQAIALIRPTKNLNPLFLKFSLLSIVSQNTKNKQRGGAIKNISLGDIKNIDYPLPPLQEQKRIVSKLDSLFEKIDKAIALHQKNMDEADVFMGSVLHEVFEKLEEKYGLTILSTVVKINSGIALPKIFKDKEHTNGELEFFKVAQMNNDTRVMKGANLNFTLSQSKEFKIKLFPKGSILIPKRGGAILTNKKRIMEREASYDSNVMGLKADNKILLDEFLFIFLKSIDLSNYIDTTTIPQVNNKHIDRMSISIPSLKIQENIITYVNKISKELKTLKQTQKEKMENLVALKASILDQAFRGEL